MQMGIPQLITIDQGSEFRNALNREITKSLGIEHRLTTVYHPGVGRAEAVSVSKLILLA